MTYASDSQLVDTTLDASQCAIPLYQLITGTIDLTTRGVQPTVGTTSTTFSIQRMDNIQYSMTCLT